MFRSIRFKLAAVLFVATTVALCVAGFANYAMSKQKLNRQLEQNVLNIVSDTAGNLSAFLSLRLAELELTGRSQAEGAGSGTMDRLRHMQRELSRGDEQFVLYTGIGGLDGRMTLSDGSVKIVSADPAFRAAREGSHAIADPAYGADGVSYELAIYVPLPDDRGRVAEVAMLALDAFKVFETYLRIDDRDADRRVNLVNGRLDVLYNSDPSVILRRNFLRDFPSERDKLTSRMDTESGIVDLEIDGPVKVFYTRVPGSDWTLSLAYGTDSFYAPQQSLLRTTLVVIAVTELVLFLLIYLALERTIIRRIRDVAAVTDRVARGRFTEQPIDDPARDELGALASSVNAMTDSLRGMFEPLETFIRSNRYAMIATDADYRVTLFNSRAEEMLGYAAEEIVARETPACWLDAEELRARTEGSGADDAGLTDAARFVREAARTEGGAEWTWIARDGRRLPVDVHVSAMDGPDGAPKGYVIVARDMTADKQAASIRDRLHSIVESAHDFIASFDARGEMFYLNEAGARMLGIADRPDAGRNLLRYLPSEGIRPFEEATANAARHGFAAIEAAFARPDGSEVAASLTIVSHRSEGGVPFFSAIARDISELKRIQRELVEASQAKSMFLARMSHEIRTPLNGVIGLSHLMLRTPLSPVQQDYMRKVTDASRSLLQMINDILDFSKIEADRLTIETAPFALEHTVHQVCGTLSVLLGYKPVEVVIDIAPGIPSMVVGDNMRLGQVLLNLMSNAVKFTDQGFVRLTVAQVSRTAEQVRLQFVVSDTGIGMTEEETRRLFEPFAQADGSISRKHGGTGLGLVIAGSLVERMGGRIELTSRKGVGSEFRFTLPFGVAREEPAPLPPRTIGVLFAEDHPEMRNNLVKLLGRLTGFCAGTRTWKEAAARMREPGIDVILLDTEAEDMFGEETWAAMKREADRLGVRTILYTTLNGRAAIEQLPESLKPDAVIAKPVSRIGLEEALAAAFARPAAPARDEAAAAVEAGADRPADALAGEPAALSAGEPATGGEPRTAVLVVEDNLVNQLVTRALLEAEGYPVAVASDGAEAIAMLAAGSYGFVFMDLHMPGIDGLETTRRIRSDPRYDRLPIVALTADTTRERHDACLRAGMNGVLTKPIQPETLYAVLNRLLGLRNAPAGRSAATAGESAAGDAAAGAAEAEPPDRVAPLDERVLDFDRTVRLMDGNEALALHVLDALRDEYADIAARLRGLLARGDRTAARRLAHSLRGAAGNLSAGEVCRLAAELESALDAAADGPLDPGLPDRLASAFDRLSRAIDMLPRANRE